MKNIVFVMTMIITGLFVTVNAGHTSDIVAVLFNDNIISFPYCWKKGNEIRFDAPGGTVGLNTSDIKVIEERLLHADTDSQYLLSSAVSGTVTDPMTILKNFLAQKRGISVSTDDSSTREAKASSLKKTQTGDVELIAPVTKVLESYVQAFKGPKGESIVFGVLVNAREKLDGRKCSLKLLDIDRKVSHVHNMTVTRVNLSKESSKKDKFSDLSYLIFTVLPGNVEFWGYDIMCDVPM